MPDKRDITNAYHNTMIEIFDDHEKSTRQFNQSVASCFSGSWIGGGEQHGKGPQSDPFWRVDNEARTIDLIDFVTFLITEKSPVSSLIESGQFDVPDYRTWWVRPSLRRMGDSERLAFFQQIVGVGLQWVPAESVIAGGFNKILDFAAGILDFCDKEPKAPNRQAYLDGVNGLFSHLVGAITAFDPDYDDYSTMRDVQRMFNYTSLFLKEQLPATFRNNPDYPYQKAFQQIAEWASRARLEPWRKKNDPSFFATTNQVLRN